MSPNQVIATNTLPTSIHSQKCSTQGNETGEIKVYKTNLTVLCHLTKLLLQTHCLQVYTAKNVRHRETKQGKLKSTKLIWLYYVTWPSYCYKHTAYKYTPPKMFGYKTSFRYQHKDVSWWMCRVWAINLPEEKAGANVTLCTGHVWANTRPQYAVRCLTLPI